MATISNPIINRAVSELMRPTAEQARALFVGATFNRVQLAALVASIAGLDDDDIIDDGRASEGIAPPTVGQIRAAAALLGSLVDLVTGDPRLPAVLGLCVRTLNVS